MTHTMIMKNYLEVEDKQKSIVLKASTIEEEKKLIEEDEGLCIHCMEVTKVYQA